MNRLYWSAAMLAVCVLISPFGLSSEPSTNQPPADAAEPVKTFTIGVVSDGPSYYFDRLCKRIEEELASLSHKDIRVVFKRDPAFDAGWDAAKIPAALQRAQDDPDVALVLASGVLATLSATQDSAPLKKPVIGGFIQDAETMGLPCDARGHSTKSNCNFVVSPISMTRQFEVFHKMIRFKTVHLIADARILAALGSVKDRVVELGHGKGFEIKMVPVGQTAGDVLDGMDNTVQAVFLTPVMAMTGTEWQKLIDGLNAKKIPTFSLVGRPDVDLGVLAGLLPDCTDRLARRIALNIQEIMNGKSPNELPVHMPVEEKLTINALTAVQIGFSPDFSVWMTAEVLHREALRQGESLKLEQAMLMAAEKNVEIAVKQAEVDASRQDRRKAASYLWPQLNGAGQYQQVDNDRAKSSGGSMAEQRTTAGAGVTQVLFNDAVISQFRAAGLDVERMLFDADSIRLDVMSTAGMRFLQYLAAMSLVQIDVQNHQLTREYLELARVRQQSGAAGPEEVYRWEAQEARQQSSVIASESKVEVARVALNQALGVAQDTRWNPCDIALADDDYYLLDPRLRDTIKNDTDFDFFRRFVVREAIDNAPSVQALDRSIRAQQIILGQLKRKAYVPVLSASFNYDYVVDQQFAGQTLQEQLAGAGIPMTAGSSPDDHEWVAVVQAQVPLFEGGGRMADVAKTRAQLNQLAQTRKRVEELIEQNAQTLMYSLTASQPNIHLSRVAADRAHKNLEVVQKKYAQGAVSILELLDAQNQAFVQDQAAIQAVYAYLQEVVQLQRAMSWFECLKTEQEKTAWLSRMEAFKKQNRPPASSP